MKANVYVTLKPDVLDPQGKSVAQALHNLGFTEVEGVRVGRLIEISLGGEREALPGRVKAMGEKLLANPVIESFRFDLKED